MGSHPEALIRSHSYLATAERLAYNKWQDFASYVEYEGLGWVAEATGCDFEVYHSADKFDSGTGWPSFTRPIEGAVGTSEDRGWFATRIEVQCRRCGSHLGQVFDDGPKPAGLRYCMTGIALRFEPTTAS